MTDAGLGPPRRGSPFTRALAHRTLRLLGWRLEGVLPDLPKFLVIVAPHTSNWDFLYCILAMFATGLRLSWLGKHTLFFFPATPILHWLGGEPLDRSAKSGTVETAIGRYNERRQWVLGVSPEGTRKRVEQWKTGFLRIARGADVPIVPISIDYRQRIFRLHPPVPATADLDADLQTMRGYFRADMARHPAQFAEPAR